MVETHNSKLPLQAPLVHCRQVGKNWGCTHLTLDSPVELYLATIVYNN